MSKSNSRNRKRNILTGLISSRIRTEILSIFFSEPDRDFYYREIVSRIGETQRGSIAREIKRLEEAGYLSSRVSGKRKHYRINTGNPIYVELKSIWAKTVGLFAQLEEQLAPLAKRIQFAFVYGSFASGTETAESDVDLMIIGTVTGMDVSKVLSGFAMRKIKQNLFWAFIYNTLGIPIAAGVLYPFTGFLLNPIIAGAAMAFSSVSVVTNSLLMRRYRRRI